MNGNVYSDEGVAPALTTNKGEGIKIAHRKREQYMNDKDQGVAIKIKSATSDGYELYRGGDSINFSFPESPTRRGRVGKGVAQTLDTQCNQGVAVIAGVGEKKSNGGTQFYQQDRVYDSHGLATSLNSQLPGGGQMYGIESDEVDTIYYPKKDCQIAIRKLTPKECFRLQGFTDEQFEKAQFVNSDSQLYKQAGNAVTVNVIEAIARKIK